VGYWAEFDAVNGLFRFTAEGRVTDEVLLEGITESRRFLASHPGVRGICDFSRVTEFDVSSEGIRGLARSESGAEADAVVIIVAPSDLMYGMSRMYSMLTEERRPNRHVVRTMEEAYELLGVTSPQFVRVVGSSG